jgi:hypothetical protein
MDNTDTDACFQDDAGKQLFQSFTDMSNALNNIDDDLANVESSKHL